MRCWHLDFADAALGIPFDLRLGRRPPRAVERDRQARRRSNRAQSNRRRSRCFAARRRIASRPRRSPRRPRCRPRAAHRARSVSPSGRGRRHAVRRHRRRAAGDIEVAHRPSSPEVQIFLAQVQSARRRSNPDRRARRLLGTNAPSYLAVNSRPGKKTDHGWKFAALRFPVATPPAPGETVPIAPGVLWLRMPLPFALDHINLWLLEDGDGWTIVDTGYAMPESRARGSGFLPSGSAGGRSPGSSSPITIPTISGWPAGWPSVGRRHCGPPKRNGCTPG